MDRMMIRIYPRLACVSVKESRSRVSGFHTHHQDGNEEKASFHVAESVEPATVAILLVTEGGGIVPCRGRVAMIWF